MRAVPYATSTVMVIVSTYLVLVWGYEGVWTLNTPLYGLGDFLSSQTVYSFGRVFDLSPAGLTRLAAVFASVKLVAVGAFIWHLVAWVRDWRAGEKRQDGVFEGALILSGLLIVVMATAPLIDGNRGLIEVHASYLLLVLLMGGALALEQLKAAEEAPDPVAQERTHKVTVGENLAPWVRRWSRWPS